MQDKDFLEIYDQYHDPVRAFIRAMVRDEWAAEDLTQETFLRVRKHLDSLKDPDKMSAWIHRVAHNLCRDHFRRARRGPGPEGRLSEAEKVRQDALLPMALEQHQMGECVQDRMALLPEALRSVLVLSDVQGLSRQETADILGLSVENVKVRLHRARKRMRSILEAHCTFERDDRNVLVCLPK